MGNPEGSATGTPIAPPTPETKQFAKSIEYTPTRLLNAEPNGDGKQITTKTNAHDRCVREHTQKGRPLLIHC